MKKAQLVENFAGGLDLLVEKDSGNEVLILTGGKKNSLEFWYDLIEKAEIAIQELEYGENGLKL